MKGAFTATGYRYKKKPIIVFHSIYAKFFISLELLEFLNTTSNQLYHAYLRSWQNNINEKIVKLDTKSKVKFDKLKQMEKSNKSKAFELHYDEPKLRQVVDEELKLARIHGKLFPFINEMGLVYLITQFEEFIKDCMKLIFSIQPLALKSGKSLEIEKLVDTKNRDEIIQLAIKKEIESVIDGGIDEIENYLKNQNIDLTKYPHWKKLKECFHRRNALIHNNGLPDEDYIKKTGTKVKNKRLDVTDNYLRNSMKLFRECSHAIAHYFDKKFYPEKDFSHNIGKDSFSIIP